MGLVWQNPIQRTAHLSVLMTVHNFSIQYNPEQFCQSPLLPPNIIAQMSIGEEGVSITVDIMKYNSHEFEFGKV